MAELLANPRLCRGCGAAGCTNKCPCKHVYYCGPECQAKDWSRHKKECAVVLDTKVRKEKREHGKDNMRVAAARAEAGDTHRQQGRFADAERSYLEARRIMAGLLGEEHPQVGFMTQTLGSLYREMERYDVALKMYDESLHIARKAEGERSKKVGDILQCMGNVLAQQKRHDSALEKYKQARGIYKETIGPEDTSMANTLTGLANVYFDIAKKAGDDSMFDKCIKYNMEALRISRIVNSREGGDGRYVAGTLMNLASVFSCLGLLDKGMAHYEEALGILRSVHGEKHPVVATVFKNIGDLLEKQGKQEEALKMYKKVLKISRKALGEAHVDVLDTLIAIGNNYLRQGRSKEALEAMEEALAALAARNRVMGVEDPYAAEVYKTMAGAKLLGGDKEGAFNCIDKAVGIYAKHGITNESSKECEQLRAEMEARVSRAP